MPETYIKAEIEELFGKEVLPKSTIQLYTDREVLKPEVVPGRRGFPRKYNVKNLVELLLCRRMVEIGFTIAQVKIILEGIKGTSHGKKLDPDIYPKIDKNHVLSLCVEYDFEDNVKVTTVSQTVAPNDLSLINVDMSTKKHIRIINVSEIIWAVKRSI